MLGGILADYIGRKRTMMIAILAYSVTTGLSAFAWNWESFAVARLIVGIAIGSEWATGASIVAELWPDRARGKGAGLMQCGLGIGFFVASLVWLFIGKLGPDAWRYMYLIGILPGFFTLWMRRGIPESEKWQQADAERRAARARNERTRFTLVELFAYPEVRRRALFAFILSLTTTLTWWGISAWLPPYVASVAAKAGLSGPAWASYAGMAYNIGAIAGYIGLGFFADRYGRRPVTLVYIVLEQQVSLASARAAFDRLAAVGPVTPHSFLRLPDVESGVVMRQPTPDFSRVIVFPSTGVMLSFVTSAETMSRRR